MSDFQALCEYERKSKLVNYSMQTGLEVLNEVYSNRSWPMICLRNLGVSMINEIPVKNGIKSIADGFLYGNSQYKWKS